MASKPSGQPSEDGRPEEANADAPKPRRTRAKKTETAEAAEDKPKRTRRKAAPSDAAEAEEKPKRSRRKKAEPEAEAAEEKPKPRRTRKKAEPVASSDAPVADEPPAADRAEENGGDNDRRNDRRNGRDQDDEARGERSQDDDRENDDRSQGGRSSQDDQQGGRGRNRKRKRNRNKNRNRNDDGGGNQPGKPFVGMLELIGDKKFGFIREFRADVPKGDNDPFMPPPLIQKYDIRDGVHLEGEIKPGRKGAWQVSRVDKIMGLDPDEWKESTEDFERGMVIYPDEKLNLIAGPGDISMRVVDLVSPIGKGQRALIVAPPRSGKTVMLKSIARGVAKNHPKVKLICLLVDERPEEVTDFMRNTEATVFASSNDREEDNHVRVSTMAFEYSKRLVEQGHDVVMLLDSLTRLGRTFNLWKGSNSGRTMSGGLDARALIVPRKIFGSARNIEGGGSLTIIATALVETGSRMDDVIFEEFKGTGNSEIVLDRELSEKRIFPAINLRKSGTRNEERLIGEDQIRQHHLLFRALNSRPPVDAMQALLRHVMTTESNEDFLAGLIPTEI